MILERVAKEDAMFSIVSPPDRLPKIVVALVNRMHNPTTVNTNAT